MSSELEEWIRETAETVADELRSALLAAAWRVGTDRRFEAAAGLVDAALDVDGAPPLEPGVLARVHAIALAGGSPAATRLAAEAAELRLSLAQRPGEARALMMAEVGTGDLPRRVTSFVGRARERVEFAPRIGEDGRPIVTLLGPGGIGKTRLALALARDRRAEGAFPGGVWFVPLAAVERPGDVGEAVATAIGVVQAKGETPFTAVARTVGARPNAAGARQPRPAGGRAGGAGGPGGGLSPAVRVGDVANAAGARGGVGAARRRTRRARRRRAAARGARGRVGATLPGARP
ncbi:MAG: hypothetical protein U5J97_00260 [Trueperaceae bacterium]|nr:hypothetical protein [Trueperaceae bacterium]